MAFHDFLQDFIDLIMQRGQQEEEGPSEDGPNPLDQAASAIGRGGLRDQAVLQSGQAPITINLEAPRNRALGSERQGKGSSNVDATLEALAQSRTAQTPNTNWRSQGARLREADLKRNRNRGRGSGGRTGGQRAN